MTNQCLSLYRLRDGKNTSEFSLSFDPLITSEIWLTYSMCLPRLRKELLRKQASSYEFALRNPERYTSITSLLAGISHPIALG